MTYKGVVTSGRWVTGITTLQINSAPGDLLVALTDIIWNDPIELVSVSGASRIASASAFGLGYQDVLFFGISLFICHGPVTVTLCPRLPLTVSPYAYALALYGGGFTSRLRLGDHIIFNKVPRGKPVTAPLPRGLFFVISGNKTWAAELSWYPTFSHPTNFNLRNHDVFFSGGIANGGTLTITLHLLERGDIVLFPVFIESTMVTTDVTFV